MVQERQQVKDQQSCISVFVAYLTIPSSNLGAPAQTPEQYSMHVRFIEIQSNIGRKKLHRTNQESNFLGSTFSNRDNGRASVQFRGESQPQHLKR